MWGGMDAQKLMDDVREGRIGMGQLVKLILFLLRRVAELEKKVRELGGDTAAKVEEPFSVRAEEKRQAARGKLPRKRKPRGRRGRVKTAEKIPHAERTEKCFPAGVAEEDCWLSHTRVAWRLENGRAVLVAYEIYRARNGTYGMVRGVLGRSEFGVEIVIAISFQVHLLGLSFDQVCLLMGFFLKLNLKKSQVDALLTQLARQWEGEFETLCTLLANSAVVHTDETGWSLKSVWAFLSEKSRVVLFGVHKDAATLAMILNPAIFAGIVVSDDAAVYENFTQSQKCWAHLLRKAIKLTLVAPDNAEYRHLADSLLEIYREACRVQRDRRLSDAGRGRKVVDLDDRIFELCGAVWCAELPPSEGPDNDCRLLCNELVRLMLARELFTFVTASPVTTPTGDRVPVAGTNNEAERTLRNPATARDIGRTNKTPAGTRRRTIHVSVLESLRCYLRELTLSSVITEVQHWLDTGRSCFVRLLKKLRLSPPEQSVLKQLYPDLNPAPSG